MNKAKVTIKEGSEQFLGGGVEIEISPLDGKKCVIFADALPINFCKSTDCGGSS